MPVIIERSYMKDGEKIMLKYPKFKLKTAAMTIDDELAFTIIKPVESREIEYFNKTKGCNQKFTIYNCFVEYKETGELGSLEIPGKIGQTLMEMGEAVVQNTYIFKLKAGNDGKNYLAFKGEDEEEAFRKNITEYYDAYVEQADKDQQDKFHFIVTYLMNKFPQQRETLKTIGDTYDELKSNAVE